MNFSNTKETESGRPDKPHRGKHNEERQSFQEEITLYINST